MIYYRYSYLSKRNGRVFHESNMHLRINGTYARTCYINAMEAQVELIEAKPKRVIRTVSMVKRFALQRTTLGFLLIFIGVILLAGVLCFSSFDNSDSDLSIDDLNQEEKKDVINPNKNINTKQKFEQKTKISLKKQIFTAIHLDKKQTNHIPTALRNWVTDFENDEHNGGFFFVSDVPIAAESHNSLIVKTAYVHDPTQKYILKMMQSMKKYQSESRAFWYMIAPINSLFNIKALPKITDYLGTLDPLNDFYLYSIGSNGNENYQIVGIYSRALVKKVVENPLSEINKNEIKQLNISKYFLKQPFEEDIFKKLEENKINDLKKCDGSEFTKLNDVFGILFGQEISPKETTKYKQLFDHVNSDNFYIQKHNSFLTLCTK